MLLNFLFAAQVRFYINADLYCSQLYCSQYIAPSCLFSAFSQLEKVGTTLSYRPLVTIKEVQEKIMRPRKR